MAGLTIGGEAQGAGLGVVEWVLARLAVYISVAVVAGIIAAITVTGLNIFADRTLTKLVDPVSVPDRETPSSPLELLPNLPDVEAPLVARANPQGLPFTKILGINVFSSDNRRVGDIRDVLIDDAGNVTVVVRPTGQSDRAGPLIVPYSDMKFVWIGGTSGTPDRAVVNSPTAQR